MLPEFIAQSITTDLENLMIQQTSTKNSDALVIHHWFVTSWKWSCHLFLAIKEKSYIFLLHRDGDTVPPAGLMEIKQTVIRTYSTVEKTCGKGTCKEMLSNIST